MYHTNFTFLGPFSKIYYVIQEYYYLSSLLQRQFFICTFCSQSFPTIINTVTITLFVDFATCKMQPTCGLTSRLSFIPSEAGRLWTNDDAVSQIKGVPISSTSTVADTGTTVATASGYNGQPPASSYNGQ